ncbi:Zinc finger, GRF-type [Sesbania bispinosa]|nr:Zinc finger, GRF-type [Sesbania bispinosa]
MENSVSSGSSNTMLPSSLNNPIQFCTCGVECKLKVSNTEKNPGRRFFGCGNYDGSSSHCDYFCWYDPPPSKYCSKVIAGMLRKNENLMVQLKAQNEEMVVLQQKLESEMADKRDLAAKVEAFRMETVKLKFLLCLTIVVVLAMWLELV